ncbi:HalOD1 output domain-containing protein [Haloterrigena sp. H1]|uniref:HalOD1 output domain-containing protein n=1 Tax=Haloterrigena sp. H1 TaxID=2552943 RepID=UPI002017FFDA|nr:HalOD1 output domain-containing protein [Haloterrigena sp. H1]
MHVDADVCQDSLTYTAADDESLSDAVIAALREAAGVTTDSDAGVTMETVGVLTPLFETIDPDALNALFSPTHSGDTRTGSVTFTHDGYDVTVTADGEITVSSQ